MQIAADGILNFFFLFFSVKIRNVFFSVKISLDISCESSAKQMILMEFKTYFL